MKVSKNPFTNTLLSISMLAVVSLAMASTSYGASICEGAFPAAKVKSSSKLRTFLDGIRKLLPISNRQALAQQQTEDILKNAASIEVHAARTQAEAEVHRLNETIELVRDNHWSIGKDVVLFAGTSIPRVLEALEPLNINVWYFDARRSISKAIYRDAHGNMQFDRNILERYRGFVHLQDSASEVQYIRAGNRLGAMKEPGKADPYPFTSAVVLKVFMLERSDRWSKFILVKDVASPNLYIIPMNAEDATQHLVLDDESDMRSLPGDSELFGLIDTANFGAYSAALKIQIQIDSQGAALPEPRNRFEDANRAHTVSAEAELAAILKAAGIPFTGRFKITVTGAPSDLRTQNLLSVLRNLGYQFEIQP